MPNPSPASAFGQRPRQIGTFGLSWHESIPRVAAQAMEQVGRLMQPLAPNRLQALGEPHPLKTSLLDEDLSSFFESLRQRLCQNAATLDDSAMMLFLAALETLQSQPRPLPFDLRLVPRKETSAELPRQLVVTIAPADSRPNLWLLNEPPPEDMTVLDPFDVPSMSNGVAPKERGAVDSGSPLLRVVLQSSFDSLAKTFRWCNGLSVPVRSPKWPRTEELSRSARMGA